MPISKMGCLLYNRKKGESFVAVFGLTLSTDRAPFIIYDHWSTLSFKTLMREPLIVRFCCF